MDRRKRTLSILCFGFVLFGIVRTAGAFHVDPKNKTLEVIGKVQSRVSFRLEDSQGFIRPADVRAGDLAQWRSLGIFEVNHDLERVTRELDILYPLKVLKIRAKYHLVGRSIYEGVYDVGPQSFKNVGDRDRENIDNFKEQYDLLEFYIDVFAGPCSFASAGRAWPGVRRTSSDSWTGSIPWTTPLGVFLRISTIDASLCGCCARATISER